MSATAGPKPPDSAQYEHPFLKFSVYDSSRELIQNGLLKREEAEVLNESETIRLVPEAIGLIEKVVIKKKHSERFYGLELSEHRSFGQGWKWRSAA